MMLVNGKQTAAVADETLLNFLERSGYNPTLIAVEQNGRVVPRAAYGQTLLSEDDVLEVVSFVGGG